MIRSFTIILIGILTLQTAWSQTQVVKDTNTAIDANLIGGKDFFVKSGNLAYFISKDDKGLELWRTDGTGEGTFRVTDLVSGISTSFTNPLGKVAVFDGDLVFNANENSTHVWKTDGTPDGTKLLATLSVEGVRLGIDQIVKLGDNKAMVYTRTLDNNSVGHIFVYDNGDETITHLKEVGPSPIGPSVARGTERAYYRFLNGATNKFEVWTSDGTLGGTHRLTAFDDPTFSNSSLSTAQFAVAGEALVVSASNRIKVVNTVTEDLVSDFTLASGELVLSLASTGSSVLVSTSQNLVAISSQGVKTTPLANVRLVDIAYDDDEVYILGVNRSDNQANLYYTDNDLTWQGDLTALGPGATVTSKNQVLTADGKIFTTSWLTATGGEPTVIENGGMTVIKDIIDGTGASNPQCYIELNGKIFFVAALSGSTLEMWTTDGTEAGTHLVLDPFARTRDGVDSRNLYAFNNQAWFLGFDQTNNADLWHSTTDGNDAVKDQELNNGFAIGSMNGEFYAWSNDLGFTKTDGNGNVTVITKPADAATSVISPDDAMRLGNKLIIGMNATVGGSLVEGYEPWVIDGTPEGTHLLKDIYPGTTSALPSAVSRGRSVKMDENTGVFAANDPSSGMELWKTDGTTEGTVMIKDITPGIAPSSISNLTSFKNKVYFVLGTTSTQPVGVWMTDGTAEGTMIVPGQDPNSRVNGNLRVVGDNLLFTTNFNGWAVYKTDGTNPVEKVKQLDDVGGTDETPANSLALGNKMYFSFKDPVHGRELWVSDGTSEGTKVIDFNPGPANSDPKPLTTADGQLYINLNQRLHHLAGSNPDIEKLSDLEPLVVVKAGTFIYFQAFSNEYGTELFSVLSSKFNQSIDFNVADRKFSDGDFQLDATTSSGLNVVYSTTSQAITIAGSNVDVKSAGKVTIQASQAGDGAFQPATPVPVTFCINPSKPQITLNGNTITSSAANGNQWFLNGNPIQSATSASLQAQETGLYTVQMSIDGCKSEMSANVTFTALEDEVGGISLYPNPAENTLYISRPGQFRIIDSTGKETLSQQVINSIDITSLNPGIYVAIIDNAHYIKFLKR